MEQDRPGTPVPAVEVPEPMETCKLGALSVEEEEEEGETVGVEGVRIDADFPPRFLP